MSEQGLLQTSRCVACGSDLAAGAYVCSNCKEYQARWRSELKFWAGIAGLIVLVSSGLAFSFGAMKFAVNYFWPPALIVSEVNSFGTLALVNMSDQNVWLKELRIRSDRPGHDLQWNIGHILKPRELYSGDMIKMSASQFRGLSRQLFGSSQGLYARNLADDTIQALRAHKLREKYVPVFLHRDGPEYRQVKEVLRSQVTAFDCRAELTYVFMESQAPRDAAIPCIGVIKERSEAIADTSTAGL
jgi:hypothetical protein